MLLLTTLWLGASYTFKMWLDEYFLGLRFRNCERSMKMYREMEMFWPITTKKNIKQITNNISQKLMTNNMIKNEWPITNNKNE